MIITKKQLLIGAVIVAAVIIAVVIAVGNRLVGITQISITADIPESFSGFKIAQVSDLHNAEIGKDNEAVIKRLKSTEPDIIVITGDFVDSRHTDISVAVAFAKRAVEIAPTYYVTGNHEARIGDKYNELREALIDMGVVVLENKAVDLTYGADAITLLGLNDTGFDLMTGIEYLLHDAMPDNNNYKILLAHRPEYFDKYDGVDLILSGHAHGGQFRLPFVGGIFAPGQGLLPKYDSGVYVEDGKTMVVSRGIGNSLFPFRINNNPEIVVVTLQKG